jgi:hypothetical protein
MFMFGSDFDTDPQLPWAGLILQGTWASGQKERADQLYEKTMHYLEHVEGPGHQHSLAAMRAVRRLNPEDYALAPGTLGSTILREMKRVYPQKCEYLGDPPLEALIRSGIEKAKSYAVTVDRAVALFPVLMFAMGHGFDADPLFPWVSKTLGDAGSDPNKRVERLYGKATIYLDQALAHLEKR